MDRAIDDSRNGPRDERRDEDAAGKKHLALRDRRPRQRKNESGKKRKERDEQPAGRGIAGTGERVLTPYRLRGNAGVRVMLRTGNGNIGWRHIRK